MSRKIDYESNIQFLTYKAYEYLAQAPVKRNCLKLIQFTFQKYLRYIFQNIFYTKPKKPSKLISDIILTILF